MSKEAMKLALKRAFQLGQDYSYQADHDSYRENKKSDETLAKFRQLVDETCEALAEQPAQQEPVALKWQQAPVKTQWGDDMVVASVAIDKDHTVDLYCERDQTPKVDAMFAQRTWVGLSDAELVEFSSAELGPYDLCLEVEAKLKEKNT